MINKLPKIKGFLYFYSKFRYRYRCLKSKRTTIQHRIDCFPPQTKSSVVNSYHLPMERHDKIVLSELLNQHLPNWDALIPDLFEYLDFITLSKGEYLPYEQNSIYIVGRGNIGQYLKDQPLAYFETGQPIISSASDNKTKLQALSTSNLLHLPAQTNYALIRKHQGAIELYQQVLSRYNENVGFKAGLWNIHKRDRLSAFLRHYKHIFPLTPRNETAKFLGISRETLRQSYE